MVSVKPLEPEYLYQRADPALFRFDTTAELEELDEVIGQPRAVAAVQLATGIEKDGFNVFALGPAGTGKRSLVAKYFKERALNEPTPDDWCYVHNFEQDYKPKAIRLPAGNLSTNCSQRCPLHSKARNTAPAGESSKRKSRKSTTKNSRSCRIRRNRMVWRCCVPLRGWSLHQSKTVG